MSNPYSYRWARNIYKQFYECYTRATDLFYEITGLEEKTAVNTLMYCQHKWEKFKKCVKVLNNWAVSVSWHEITNNHTFITDYLNFVKRNKYLNKNFTPLNCPEVLDKQMSLHNSSQGHNEKGLETPVSGADKPTLNASERFIEL